MLSKPILTSFDTGMIITYALREDHLEAAVQIYRQINYTLVISSEAEEESIVKLGRTWRLPDASQKVKYVISRLDINIDPITQADEDEGDNLIDKYKNVKDKKGRPICHWPDSSIIAHIKRLGVELALTTDENFDFVCRSEGIETRLLPAKR